MKKILLIGAGRSTTSLVDYIINNAEKEDWHLTVADNDESLAREKAGNHDRTTAIGFDVKNQEEREKLIAASDLVISMLPAQMHVPVAVDCIRFKTNMVTASYISNEMQDLDSLAKEAGVTIINEIGVDPGIDHLSAKKIIDGIHQKGGKLMDFESFTGGLVAPESDNNPWNYKLTWNPRNVVLAGQGGAVKFIQEGSYKYIPYHKLFRRTELIDIEGFGKFEGYANRDSLKYRSIYDLDDIRTMFRGTLRRPGFCRAWDVFVQLGATDDSYIIENSEDLTFRSFINLFLAYNPHDSVELKLKYYLRLAQDDVALFEKLEWLDIFKDIPVEIEKATPAQIMQKIIERKWVLEENDNDMIVMWHKFIYELQGHKKELHSSMVVKGKDKKHTAMAITVGLPVAICSKMILNGVIDKAGVHIPISQDIYNPILEELQEYGIKFSEKEIN